MGYNLLLIDKSENEYIGNYEKIISLNRSLIEFLKNSGHQIRLITDLEEITDKVYSSQDCIIVHPTTQKLRRLLELHISYPQVGLILTTGPGVEEDEFNEMTEEEDGIFFLGKPFSCDTFLESIDQVISSRPKNPK